MSNKINRSRKISNYSLKKASEHVLYEVWMFFQTLELLLHNPNQLEINILLDAFAIHTRNLFDFLYPKRNYKKDDIIIYDYIINRKNYERNKTLKVDLKFIVRKADKQVAHLTYSRNKYNTKTKPWAFLEIGRKMHLTLSAFCKSLDKRQQQISNFLKLKSILDKYQNL